MTSLIFVPISKLSAYASKICPKITNAALHPYLIPSSLLIYSNFPLGCYPVYEAKTAFFKF
jgi:hypothetical protein